jgi:hypothetical protein
MDTYRNFVYIDNNKDIIGITAINTLYERNNDIKYGLKEYNKIISKAKYRLVFDAIQRVRVNDKNPISMFVGIQ